MKLVVDVYVQKDNDEYSDPKRNRMEYTGEVVIGLDMLEHWTALMKASLADVLETMQ